MVNIFSNIFGKIPDLYLYMKMRESIEIRSAKGKIFIFLNNGILGQLYGDDEISLIDFFCSIDNLERWLLKVCPHTELQYVK